jgi:hypothetical protein
MSPSILDDLIEAYDKNRDREPAKTAEHRERQLPRAPNDQTEKALSEAERIEAAMKTRRGTRGRAKSKQQKDVARYELRLEKQRLFNEAFWDVGAGSNPSPGEVDALTNSELLNVDRGDVLRDPKVRGYKHPALQDWWQVTGDELRARVAAGSKETTRE